MKSFLAASLFFVVMLALSALVFEFAGNVDDGRLLDRERARRDGGGARWSPRLGNAGGGKPKPHPGRDARRLTRRERLGRRARRTGGCLPCAASSRYQPR
jgi:hypothetical protein